MLKGELVKSLQNEEMQTAIKVSLPQMIADLADTEEGKMAFEASFKSVSSTEDVTNIIQEKAVQLLGHILARDTSIDT